MKKLLLNPAKVNTIESDDEGGCCVIGHKKTHWYAATTTTSSTSVTASSTTTTSSCLGKTEEGCIFYCYKPFAKRQKASLMPPDVAQLGDLLQQTVIHEQPRPQPN